MLRDSELLLAVADVIEQRPEQYNQGAWYYGDWDRIAAETGVDVDDVKALDVIPRLVEGECGTMACVAGWCVALNLDEQEIQDQLVDRVSEDICRVAVGLLDGLLSRRVAELLFNDHWRPSDDLTVPEALRYMANGISIGKVSNTERLPELEDLR